MPNDYGEVRYDSPSMPNDAMAFRRRLDANGVAHADVCGFATRCSMTAVSGPMVCRGSIGKIPDGIGRTGSEYTLWVRENGEPSAAWLMNGALHVPQYLTGKGLAMEMVTGLMLMTFIGLVDGDGEASPTLVSTIESGAELLGRELPAFLAGVPS